jgi:hypothetical protein
MMVMDALTVMSLFVVSGAVGVGVAWVALSAIFVLLRHPLAGK